MAQALDRNTGLPMNVSGLAASIGFSQSQTTGPKTESATATSSTTEKVNSSVSSASNQVNTTPGALQALDMLIKQLSDRPNISQEELNAKYPVAVMSFHPTAGWSYKDPTTGITLTPQEAQAFNAKQQVSRNQALQAAGVTAGGTEEQKAQSAERKTEIDRNRKQQGDYSKGAAISDAQFLINKSIGDALEAALPQITAGLEGAGTSRSTIAAGLTQKAVLKGATEGAALGANLSVQYGNISNQLSGVLEMLTRSDPNSPAAMLLQAIIGSKGLVSSGLQSQSTSGTTQKTGTTQTETNTSPQTQVINRNPIAPSPLITPYGTGAANQVPAAVDNSYVFAGNPLPLSSVTPSSDLDANYRGLYGDSGTNAADLYNVGED